MITLVTGGIKSGKSSHALEILKSFQNCAFIATTDPDDESMKEKILAHRKERENLSITVFEEKVNISPLVKKLSFTHDAVILDCLTMWMSNVMFTYSEKSERDFLIGDLLTSLSSLPNHCIIITNETGLGIVPENKLARAFGQELGVLNQSIARISDSVIFMVSGIPWFIKNGPK